jgi:flagella basal body P-ring formation protein FlgA
MIRPLLALIATALLATTAAAAPVLRTDVVVAAAIVTVGDMFADAGAAAEQPLFRAPQPGTSGQVSLAEVTAAATRAGLGDFQNNGALSVRVSRAAAMVDEAVLTDLITRELQTRGIAAAGTSAQILFSAPVPTLAAEAIEQPARIENLRYLPASGAFTARFAIAGHPAPLDLAGSIELLVEAPHLAANLAAGTVLTPADIVMRPIPAHYAESLGVAQPDQLVGMQLNRQSRQGMILKPADVAQPLTVARNDLVTIYFRRGAMTLTVKGQAVTGAAAGAPLQVLNLMSNRVLSATVLSPGAVEVSADPLTLAGL